MEQKRATFMFPKSSNVLFVCVLHEVYVEVHNAPDSEKLSGNKTRVLELAHS